ncbi:MAG: hypothetical protein ACLVL2_15810, partial [Bacteroides cellulosilyticus]
GYVLLMLREDKGFNASAPTWRWYCRIRLFLPVVWMRWDCYMAGILDDGVVIHAIRNDKGQLSG